MPAAPDVLVAIEDHAATGPDFPAVRDLTHDFSYAALLAEARRLAGGLASRGVESGDRVALYLPNSAEFVVAAVACLGLGAIFVPLSVTDPEARLATIVADCSPAIVLMADPSEEAPAAQPAFGASALPFGDVLMSAGQPSGWPGVGGGGSAATPAGPAYAIYTSGTTGTPKGVLIGRRAFAAAVQSTIAALGLSRDTRTLCVSPFHFDGSFGTLFPTLSAGGAVIIRPREALLFPRTFFNAVTKERVTYTGFSPSYLRLLLASPQMSKLADSALDVIALGGEASSLSDIQALWAVAPRVRVFNRYGPTETTIAVTHVHVTPDLVADGVVPMGAPHPEVSFHLVNERNEVVAADGEVGELYIGGAQLMDGYWGAPELTEAVVRADIVPGDVVYRTGDLVYHAPNGQYVYVDRADRVIKRSGVRISLVELGEAVRGLAGVAAAACTTYESEGELGIVAFAVPEEGETLSPQGLLRAARGVLPESMLPNRVELVDSLPLTASSKLDERLLLANAGLIPWRAPGSAAASASTS
jgi:amino acid adenylation domain-containing protein